MPSIRAGSWPSSAQIRRNSAGSSRRSFVSHLCTKDCDFPSLPARSACVTLAALRASIRRWIIASYASGAKEAKRDARQKTATLPIDKLTPINPTSD